jgi:hypothetical protein
MQLKDACKSSFCLRSVFNYYLILQQARHHSKCASMIERAGKCETNARVTPVFESIKVKTMKVVVPSPSRKKDSLMDEEQTNSQAEFKKSPRKESQSCVMTTMD